MAGTSAPPGGSAAVTPAGQRWTWRITTLTLALAAIVALVSGPYRQYFASAVAGSRADDRPEPCLPGEARPLLDSPHISQAQARTAHYNSDPPTSGPHFAFVVAPGIYSDEIADGLAIHALEHGHVVIQYSPDTPPATVDRLRVVAQRYAADVILAPRAHLRGIALTAWGRIDLLPAYDEVRIVAFVTTLRGRYNHGWATASRC